MRPSVGSGGLPTPSRKHSFADPEVTTPTPLPGNGVPTTFFIATEGMLDSSGHCAGGTGAESSFGVRSLESTIDTLDHENINDGQKGSVHEKLIQGQPTSKGRAYNRLDCSSDNLSQASASSSPDLSPRRRHRLRPWSETAAPHRISTTLPPPAPTSSLPDSPKSMSTQSLSEESLEDGASQAIISSGDEDADPQPHSLGNPLQLIMPSIMMPSRRPFTDRGRRMGRLKVLVAGASGVGKSSLIRSIVQVCEDIVHVDPLSPNLPSIKSSSTQKHKGHSQGAYGNRTECITEVYASTKAYPAWWSEFEENKVLPRRKSGGEAVLERNICFVDTPGYDFGTSMLEGMEPILQYIESQMAKNTSFASMSDGDLLSMLGGDGGFQVDLVLYLIMQNLNPADIEFLSRLSQATNVIPLIAKGDTLSDEEVRILKGAVQKELELAGMRPFIFPTEQLANLPPYTICSSPSNDEDNMDASLLMSSDYMQPLLPSELSILVKNVFSNDNASWLRHSAAKKIIQWRKTPRAMSIITPTSRISFAPHYSRANTSSLTISTAPPSPSQAMISLPSSPLTYAQARVADHTQREERLAQIHLANWASSLQKSLQNERERYETLAHVHRTAWLKERLDECKIDGDVAFSGHVTAHRAITDYETPVPRETSTRIFTRRGLMDPVDPLGLIRWNEGMKKRSWIAFQVLGSFGVLGAVAVWVVRHWGASIGFDGSTNWGSGWFGGNGLVRAWC